MRQTQTVRSDAHSLFNKKKTRNSNAPQNCKEVKYVLCGRFLFIVYERRFSVHLPTKINRATHISSRQWRCFMAWRRMCVTRFREQSASWKKCKSFSGFMRAELTPKLRNPRTACALKHITRIRSYSPWQRSLLNTRRTSYREWMPAWSVLTLSAFGCAIYMRIILALISISTAGSPLQSLSHANYSTRLVSILFACAPE